QEDAHEFLRHLVGKMAEGCLERCGMSAATVGPLAETTAVHRIFGGYIRDQLKCRSCGYCRDKYEAFLDLSLSLPLADGVDGVCSLEELFERFTAVELMDEDNLWECGGCERKVRAEKRVTVYKPPNALVLNLKRTAMPWENDVEKLEQEVKFTGDLRLEVSGPERFAEYVLTGVVVHEGPSMSSGHYYAHVRSAAGQWQKMDDRNVTAV
ncbi:unnamed protein product, partial [Sphacelaria rigidula]